MRREECVQPRTRPHRRSAARDWLMLRVYALFERAIGPPQVRREDLSLQCREVTFASDGAANQSHAEGRHIPGASANRAPGSARVTFE